MKYKRYNKVKKRILLGASSGILAGMMWMGSGTAYADTQDYSSPTEQVSAPTGMHLMHSWNSTAKVGKLATSLGLDRGMVKKELKSGKTLKQILQEHGIVPDQLDKAFTIKNKKSFKK
ncbi:MAG: hypothetical protein V4473_01150 [Patescibacteria group bacterium]